MDIPSNRVHLTMNIVTTLMITKTCSQYCRILVWFLEVLSDWKWPRLQPLACSWQQSILAYLLPAKELWQAQQISVLSIKRQLGQSLPALLTSHQGSHSCRAWHQDMWNFKRLLQEQCLVLRRTILCQDCLLIWEVRHLFLSQLY